MRTSPQVEGLGLHHESGTYADMTRKEKPMPDLEITKIENLRDKNILCRGRNNYYLLDQVLIIHRKNTEHSEVRFYSRTMPKNDAPAKVSGNHKEVTAIMKQILTALGQDERADIEREVLKMLQAGYFIKAIKKYRELSETFVSIKEAKLYVDGLKTKYKL